MDREPRENWFCCSDEGDRKEAEEIEAEEIEAEEAGQPAAVETRSNTARKVVSSCLPFEFFV